jgi:ABC-type multidrug transport system ATPase subunit
MCRSDAARSSRWGDYGAGTTTTIPLMLGVQRSTRGAVARCAQHRSHQREAIHQRIGVQVACPSCYGHPTGHENLAIGARLTEVAPAVINDVRLAVDLRIVARRKVWTNSQGMKLGPRLAWPCSANPN